MLFAEYVTHSCSRMSLEYIFTYLLPPLDGKRVLDVGSRFGAVLFGAHLLSDAKEILGVEMNGDLCKLAEEVIER